MTISSSSSSEAGSDSDCDSVSSRREGEGEGEEGVVCGSIFESFKHNPQATPRTPHSNQQS